MSFPPHHLFFLKQCEVLILTISINYYNFKHPDTSSAKLSIKYIINRITLLLIHRVSIKIEALFENFEK